MSKRFLFILALLCTVPGLAADPTISDLTVSNISHSSARVTFTASPAVNKQVAWDTKAYWDANQVYRYKTGKWANRYATEQSIVVTGLTPGTTYYACPKVCDASSNCVACDASSPKVEFTTLAEPSSHPALPSLPDNSWMPGSVPAADATLTVAGDCSDLESKIAAAASATYTDQTVHVVIPAGTTCTIGGENQTPDWLTLPAKSGSGWIVIRSGGTLPPFGTRLSPAEYAGQLVTFNNTVGSGGNSNFNTGQYQEWTSHHYWFSGIQFTFPPIAGTNDVNGSAGYQRQLVGLYKNIHHFVWDRCWFNGRGYPDRTLIGVIFADEPSNIAFVDNYFSGMSIWRAYQSGIAVTHTSAARNTYTGGTVYFGNASASISAFSVELSGSGTGHFRFYAERDGSVKFKHDIASGLSVTCTGCTASYDATLAVPVNAFRLMANDDSGNTVITNAQFKTAGGTSTGVPWAIQDGSDSGAGWEGSFDLYLSNIHYLLARNNYFGATGINVYSETGSPNADNLEFIRNTFQSDPALFVKTPGDSNRVGLRRQHFELKSGNTVLVEGNQFLDAWVGVSGVPSSAIYLANRTDASSTPKYPNMWDVTIRNNLIVKHPSCFQIAGTEADYQQGPLLVRLLIENNVCEADAFERRLFTFGPGWDGAMRGHQIEALVGGEDWIIRHNTFYGGIGSQPSMLRLTDGFFEGLTVQDNIFFLQQSEMGASWGKGLHSRVTYANESGTPDLSTIRYGSEALNAIAIRVPSTPSWTFDHNVIVTGCTDPTNCTSETTDLLSVATESAAYPSGNYWPTGSTYGARIAAVGWTSPGLAESSDYSLSASSAYKGQGTAGTDPGVNWSILQEALLEEVNTEANSIFRGTVLLQGTLVVR